VAKKFALLATFISNNALMDLIDPRFVSVTFWRSPMNRSRFSVALCVALTVSCFYVDAHGHFRRCQPGCENACMTAALPEVLSLYQCQDGTPPTWVWIASCRDDKKLRDEAVAVSGQPNPNILMPTPTVDLTKMVTCGTDCGKRANVGDFAIASFGSLDGADCSKWRRPPVR
jgi:hypothetical protein